MSWDELGLNDAAVYLAEAIMEDSEHLGAEVHDVVGAQVIDCGVLVPGSLTVGTYLAEACLAGIGNVSHSLDTLQGVPCPKVTVNVDEPVAACLLSQYAGWRLSINDFFAMASGPARVLRGKEPVLEDLDYDEEADVALAVLETSELPDEDVIEAMCEEIDCDPTELIVLAARTASIAGAVQVCARSVETAMHKLFELDFDVTRVRSGIGSAFLPPIPSNDLTALGRTNDSILYGAQVWLWVHGDDESIEAIGPQVPATASKDYGQPFASIFKQYEGDFYKIDPLLFSPAQIVINNLSTGSCFSYGKTDFSLVKKSFFG